MANGDHATRAHAIEPAADPADITANDVVAESWTDLNDHLFADTWDAEIGRFRSRFAYRGMASSAYDLTTSLRRLGGAYHALEAHLLRNFVKYARRTQVPDTSPWHWLALAQHHGLPTRMLDWTFSPYVALHFATTIDRVEEIDTDAIVWCVDYVRTNTAVPDGLKTILAEEDAEVFSAEMLLQVAGSLGEFDALAPEPFVVFFEPPSLDDRIVNQAALFSLMSSPTARLDCWLAARPEAHRRIIIPAALKHEVRDKLDQANITERVLFPGLDGLSRWMRRYYAPPMRRTAEADGNGASAPPAVKDAMR
jgi:hypothetical protein